MFWFTRSRKLKRLLARIQEIGKELYALDAEIDARFDQLSQTSDPQVRASLKQLIREHEVQIGVLHMERDILLNTIEAM